MYLTILEKNILNPVYLRRIWLMNSSEQKSNLRCSGFFAIPNQTVLHYLVSWSVFSTTSYSLLWLLICKGSSHTTQKQRLRTHGDLMTSEGSPSLGSTCILVCMDCQSWSCRNIYVYSQAITALKWYLPKNTRQ